MKYKINYQWLWIWLITVTILGGFIIQKNIEISYYKDRDKLWIYQSVPSHSDTTYYIKDTEIIYK